MYGHLLRFFSAKLAELVAGCPPEPRHVSFTYVFPKHVSKVGMQLVTTSVGYVCVYLEPRQSAVSQSQANRLRM